jgi:hypothetical protein
MISCLEVGTFEDALKKAIEKRKQDEQKKK